MTDIISEIELENKLNQFRDVLINYDYSDIDNVIFLIYNHLIIILNIIKEILLKNSMMPLKRF